MAYQSKYTGLQIDDILDSVEWKEGKIEDLEQIRAGAQKGATALQSYTEKYTGTVTGIKINGETKSGSGVIDLGTISTDISGKVDKVAGKQLTTEDFTTALKNKLEGLSNYDDTELSNAVETLRGDFDEIVSGDTTTAIKTFNEVIAFLDGITDTQDLESIIASIEQQIAGKMDTLISGTNIKTINGESILGEGDLTVEGGAKVYEWVLQSDGTGYATGTLTKEEVENIRDCDILIFNGIPTMKMSLGNLILVLITHSIKGEDLEVYNYAIQINVDSYEYLLSEKSAIIPTATSQLENDSNFVSSDGLKTINGESIVGSGDIAIQGGSGTITGVSANGTSVATSGVANIPAASTSAYGVTKLSSATNSTSTTEAATPSAVKAAYDLANGKQDKLVGGTNIKNVYTTNSDRSILGSGELYLASVIPDTSKVIATGIWNNYDVVEINTSGITFIPEEEGPDTPRWSIHRSGDGTKFLADDGTYKTISSGGGSSSSGITSVKINGVSKSPSSGVVDLGYINKQLSTSTSSSMTLSPNIYYRNTSTTLSTLTITLGSVSNSNIINEYFVEFTTRSAGTTVSLPSTIKWANGETPTFETSTTYQISIVNNLGVVTKFN